jgi:glycosyltransferase involved in cell wall biosynthesis
VPDLTCVWGAKWRDTLVRDGHYPADAVVVTGDWRYDDVKRRLAEVDVRALRRRLGVADGNAIAAILSSGQGTVDYVSAALDAVGSTPQLSPLIRLHPSDDPAPVRAELRRRRLPETVMPRVELLEILAASRIVISQWSTVIAEAALAGRDIMLVNLQGLPGAEAYIEAGICVPAVDSSGIRRGIDAILHDDPIQRQLAASRASFVRDYFFNADGRAAERVAEALDRLSA